VPSPKGRSHVVALHEHIHDGSPLAFCASGSRVTDRTSRSPLTSSSRVMARYTSAAVQSLSYRIGMFKTTSASPSSAYTLSLSSVASSAILPRSPLSRMTMCLRMLSSVCGCSSLRRLYRDRKPIITSTAVIAQMAWIASNRSLPATSASVISPTSSPIWTCCAAMLSCTLRMYRVIRTAAELRRRRKLVKLFSRP